MALSLIASTSANNAAAGTTLDAGATLNIAAGDIIVTAFICHGNFGGVVSVAVADTSGNNVHTMATQSELNDALTRIGYRLVGEADAAATIRVTTSNISNRAMVVFQFRPDGGDTPEFDVESQGSSVWGAAASSGNITTTGDDEVVVAAISNDHARTYSSQNIGGSAADGVVSPTGDLIAMYTIYSSTQTNIAGTATLSSAGTWSASIISIKSVAGGGGISIPVVMHHLAMAGGR